MHRIVASLAALGMSAAFGTAAWAADLGRPAPAPVYTKAPMVAPPLTWTGCHLGGNIGGAFIHNKDKDPTAGDADLGSDSPSGFIGGGQVGCDYQAGPWVFGVQGMFDWADVKGSHTVPGSFGFASISNDDKWFATATARVGYAVQPALLLYARGGAAWTRNDLTASSPAIPFDSATADRVGWTAGAGLEYMFAPSWSVFGEYNFMDFGTKTVNFPLAGPLDAKQDIQTVTVGVNWHLRPW
jgi:outer membrane immunogenic protein